MFEQTRLAALILNNLQYDNFCKILSVKSSQYIKQLIDNLQSFSLHLWTRNRFYQRSTLRDNTLWLWIMLPRLYTCSIFILVFPTNGRTAWNARTGLIHKVTETLEQDQRQIALDGTRSLHNAAVSFEDTLIESSFE